jgi:hypothetical protein
MAFPVSSSGKLAVSDEHAGTGGQSRQAAGHRHAPYAFTEQGVAMLSSVLCSPQAVRINIEIMRAFVRPRRRLSEHKAPARRIDELEARYDMQLRSVFEAIRQLMRPPENQGNPLGFTARIFSKER